MDWRIGGFVDDSCVVKREYVGNCWISNIYAVALVHPMVKVAPAPDVLSPVYTLDLDLTRFSCSLHHTLAYAIIRKIRANTVYF
jgi:hypothetical protein